MTSMNNEEARAREKKLVDMNLVRVVPGTPLRIVYFDVSKNVIGTPQVWLRLFNESGKTVRAYKILASLYDDFSRPACLGNRSQQILTSQEENIRPGSVREGGWTLYTCDTATRFAFTVTEVVFTDGSSWRGQ